MDCSPTGSFIHRIFQPRELEWIDISFSRRFSWPRDLTQVSCIAGTCFTIWAKRESHKVVLKHIEDHLILSHLPENFHPNLFTQCSCILPQFSCFQSEIPVFRLWECNKYTCPWPTGTLSFAIWRWTVLLHIPWACWYIPLRRQSHLYALWYQQVTSLDSGGPAWALTSHSPMLTPLKENRLKLTWFVG